MCVVRSRYQRVNLEPGRRSRLPAAARRGPDLLIEHILDECPAVRDVDADMRIIAGEDDGALKYGVADR